MRAYGDEEVLSDSESEITWSFKKICLLLSLCLVETLVFAAIDLISPFFSNEARDKGVSSSVVGIIFAAYPLVAGVFSPVCTLLIVKWGPRFVLMVGLFVAGTCQALFGLCGMIQDEQVFVFVCFTLRSVNALGAAACETSIFSVTVREFPGHTSTIMGILESCLGIGSLASPAIGGILYSVGGFSLPFVSIALSMFALFPMMYLTLPKHEVPNTPSSLRLLGHFIRMPPILLVVMCIFIGSTSSIFLEPIYSLHAKKVFGLNATEIGFIFMFNSIVYIVAVPFFGWISDKTQCYRLIIVIGFLGLSLGYLLVGPAPLLDFFLPARSLTLEVLAFGIIGLFFGMIFVPAMSDMLLSAKQYGMEHNEATYSTVSGIFISMINFGEAFGTILAGFLNDYLGFAWATSVVAIIAGCQVVVIATLMHCEKAGVCCFRFDQTCSEQKEFSHAYQAILTSE